MPPTFPRALRLLTFIAALTTVAAAQTLTPATVTFASTNIGVTSTAQLATLTNTQTTVLAISAKAISGTNAGDFTIATTGTTCGATLAVAASCNIAVTFTPTAAGARTATLKVTDNGTTTSQQITLNGTGAAAPTDTVSASTIAFGNGTVGVASAAQTVSVTNSGSGPLTITSVVISGANAGDFATTNNCGTTLAINASCMISATFTATATGARSAIITLTDNAADSPRIVSLTGTGVAATVPGASLAPTSLTFASTNIGTTATAQVVTVTNSGTAALSLTSIAFSGTNAGDFAITTNTCTGTLAVSATCNVSVTFTPTASGARSAALTATDNAGGTAGTQQSVAISGTGAGVAAVTLSASTLTFSSNVGTATAAQTVMVTNSGSAALTLTSVTLGGTHPGDYAIDTNTCTASLAASASCNVSVTFDPTATGARAASLIFTDSATGSPQTVALSGTGVGVASATLAPTALTFSSNIGVTTGAQAVTLSNPGSGALTVSSIAISGANASEFATTNNCAGSVAASGSCSISVTFDPSAAGARTATLTVTDNASGSPQQVTLSGTGVGVPTATVSAGTLTFGSGNIGVTSAAQSITVSNSGTGALSFSGAVVSGTNAGDFAVTGNTCGTSVAANASCSISVTFTATTTGARAATLVITDNAGNTSGSTQSVSLSGTGVAVPQAALSPTSLDLGGANTGVSTSARSLSLSNSGTGVLTIASVTLGGANAGDFSIISNNCGTSVGVSGSCNISIAMAPTAVGTRSATLIVTDNAGNQAGSQQTAGLTGTGVALALASVSPTSIGFGTSTAPQTVTLSNTGTGTLSITGVSIGGSNASNFGIFANSCGSSLTAGSTCTISVSYTPSSSGATSATLTITDNANNAAGSTQTVALAGQSALTISTQSLNNGSTGTAYSASVVPQGGTSPYSWSVSSGSLPAGLALNTSNGAITGTPNSASSATFTIKVNDNSSPVQSVTHQYTITISAPTLTVDPAALSGGTVGSAFSVNISVQGGTLPYTWAVTSGSVPPGTTLNSSTGVISGTPTTAGTFPVTIRVVDSSSPVQTATQPFSLVINAATLKITTSSLINPTVSVAYSSTLAATGGITPYTWSLASGTLPTGLTLSAAGVISGTSTDVTLHAFTVKVVDSSSPAQSATQALTLQVATPTAGPAPSVVFGFAGLPATPAPGANVTTATVTLAPASTMSGTLTASLTSSIAGLPAGYLGDAGFVASDGTKSSSVTISATSAAAAVAIPTFDPGTVAGSLTLSLTANSEAAVTSSAMTVQPAAPIIEAGSVQINSITSTGFNVELVATSTTRELQTATFTFNPASGAQLTGTSFSVNVASLLTSWFSSTSGLGYGGAFSLTIPFTLSGSANAIASVTVTLSNSIGTSTAATGVF